MTATNKRTKDLPLDVLSILHGDSRYRKSELLENPDTSDAIRLAFKDDAPVYVRAAAREATSDTTRLAFKDDADSMVRATAVDGAKWDVTRLAFTNDADPQVRAAAISGLESATILGLAFKREKKPEVRSAIRTRIRELAEIVNDQSKVMA
jgi:hypothetical protein